MERSRSQHDRYVAFFEKRRGPRDAKDEAGLLEVADAFDAAMDSGELTYEQLQRVVDGASSPRSMLWSNSVDLLRVMSGKWPAVAEAITEMFKNRQAHVRFAALCSLGEKTPEAVTDELLKAALRDKSARVRWKAVDRANRLSRVGLVPEIAAALDVEPAGKARRSMELDFRMLRDGYWVRRESPERMDVTVRISNGICSVSYKNEEFLAKGLDAILAECRGK